MTILFTLVKIRRYSLYGTIIGLSVISWFIIMSYYMSYYYAVFLLRIPTRSPVFFHPRLLNAHFAKMVEVYSWITPWVKTLVMMVWDISAFIHVNTTRLINKVSANSSDRGWLVSGLLVKSSFGEVTLIQFLAHCKLSSILVAEYISHQNWFQQQAPSFFIKIWLILQ